MSQSRESINFSDDLVSGNYPNVGMDSVGEETPLLNVRSRGMVNCIKYARKYWFKMKINIKLSIVSFIHLEISREA